MSNAAFWRGRRVLVTGGAGFLGSNLCHALAAHGARVVVTGRDQGRLDATRAALAGGGHGAIASGTRGATDASPRTLAPWPTRLVDSPIGPVPEGWRVGQNLG